VIAVHPRNRWVVKPVALRTRALWMALIFMVVASFSGSIFFIRVTVHRLKVLTQANFYFVDYLSLVILQKNIKDEKL
jgi:hypothetical protein